MPSYKLIYFNARGRAELARLIFAEAGQEYEDERFEREKWPEIKPKMPLGQVPVLMIDDKPLPQSMVIDRYLARKFNLDGSTPEIAAHADVIITSVEEVCQKVPFFEKDPAKKEVLMKECFQNHICPLFEKLEKKYSDQKKEFLTGKEFTYADLSLLHTMTSLEMFSPGFSSKYTNLNALIGQIKERPNIKAWIAKRPQTEF